ncbi:hypothetical protein ACHAW6_012313, partial [Cyclotella cf. meneghiniana]
TLNVYELPSIAQSILYLHATTSFPTKSTWLAVICKGNYSTWPLINVTNVNKHFPQSKETQQGHMQDLCQGIRSTKQVPTPTILQTPLAQQRDIFICTYDTHNTIYTDQTGQFPHLFSQGNRYQMILYHVNSNSIWVKPTTNKTEGQLIFARECALQCMKPSSVAQTPNSLYTSGANYFHSWSANLVSYIFPMHTHIYPHMHISMDITTTTLIPLCHLAWKSLSMTNPIDENHLHNIAQKGMSLEHPTSTIAVRKYGPHPHGPPASLPLYSSNIST